MSENVPMFPPRADPDPEHRYTLKEAAVILARQECDREGHALEETLQSDLGRTTVRHHIVCRRCGAIFRESTS